MYLKVSVVLRSRNVKAHLNTESSTMESNKMSHLECKQSQVSQNPFPKTKINPLQSNFCANRILPSSYLLWAGKRLVDCLLAKVHTT